jgi:hypothetical protein
MDAANSADAWSWWSRAAIRIASNASKLAARISGSWAPGLTGNQNPAVPGWRQYSLNGHFIRYVVEDQKPPARYYGQHAMDLRYRITCVGPFTCSQECRKVAELGLQGCSFLRGELPHHSISVKVPVRELYGHTGLPYTPETTKCRDSQLDAAGCT